MLDEWLSNLPDTVVEDVVQSFQARLENCLMDGMEENLSRITQNSYNIRTIDLFFSVNSLLTVVQGFQTRNLFKSLKDRFENNHSSIKPDLYQLESKA